jgi:hypothetical protein
MGGDYVINLLVLSEQRPWLLPFAFSQRLWHSILTTFLSLVSVKAFLAN